MFRHDRDEWDYSFITTMGIDSNRKPYDIKTLRIYHCHSKEGSTEYITNIQLDNLEWETAFECGYCGKKMPKKMSKDLKIKLIMRKYEINV